MPFINGKHYMNPQYGAAMERARQTGEGKFGTILSVLADILDELNHSSKGSSGELFGRQFKPPSFGGGSAQGADASPSRLIPEPYPAPGVPQDPENARLRRHGREIFPIPLARGGVQGEFVQERQGAQRAGQQQHQSQADDSADGHWVTIDHQHVFIQEWRRTKRPHPRAQANGNKHKAEVGYGETAGLLPERSPKAPAKTNPYDRRTWDEDSMHELQQARRNIMDISQRNSKVRRGQPGFDTTLQAVWNDNMEAAKSSTGSLSGNYFFIRQEGVGPQRPPKRAGYGQGKPIRTCGPFRNVGGGDVPKGERTYIDIYDH